MSTREFYTNIDRADRTMYGRVWNDETGTIEFETTRYVGKISGRSEQLLAQSCAMDALDWATSQRVNPYEIEDLGEYVDIEKWR